MKKHDNVLSALADSIWLATESHVETVAHVAESILSGDNSVLREAFLAGQGETSDDSPSYPYLLRNGVAIVPVRGTILPRATVMTALSGGVSTESLKATVDTLTLRDDVHTILLDIDSNGGEVHGLESCAASIRAARKTKRVVALANYNMNSAAYWLGSAAEKVFVTPTSNIGSIGVLAVLSFAPGSEQKRVTIIRSVPGKANITPYEPLTESARNTVQERVGKIHAAFVQAVSLNRNISMDKANELADGHVDLGADAVASGLADGVVGSVEDLLTQIDAMQDQAAAFVALREAYQTQLSTVVDMQGELAEANAELASASARVNELEAAEAERVKDAKMARAELVVEKAVRAGRIAPATAEGFRADLISGELTFDAFERFASAVPDGAAVPQESLVPVQGNATIDADAPSNETERRMMAQIPALKTRFKL